MTHITNIQEHVSKLSLDKLIKKYSDFESLRKSKTLSASQLIEELAVIEELEARGAILYDRKKFSYILN